MNFQIPSHWKLISEDPPGANDIISVLIYEDGTEKYLVFRNNRTQVIHNAVATSSNRTLYMCSRCQALHSVFRCRRCESLEISVFYRA